MEDRFAFVRGNQQNYMKIPLKESVLCGHEYQMCVHNAIKSILPFQKRNQNGQAFIYYEISGTQSLDIHLQSQKLRRPFAILLAKSLIRLCQDLKEYLLTMECVVLEPKYMMYRAKTEEIQFVYTFQEREGTENSLERLLECCIDYLDYDDKKLTECVFQIYEHLQDQGFHFSLEKELEVLLEKVMQHSELARENTRAEPLLETEESEIECEPPPQHQEDDKYFQKDETWFNRIMNLFRIGERRSCRRKQISFKESEETVRYMQEYEELIANSVLEEDGTQFISIEHMQGILYNLHGIMPQCIYITEQPKLIGKDREKVHICVVEEGISRIHAKIVKNGEQCFIEDLCSTNGTRINGENIEPRVPYVLQEGDRVCFAGTEYIFH